MQRACGCLGQSPPKTAVADFGGLDEGVEFFVVVEGHAVLKQMRSARAVRTHSFFIGGAGGCFDRSVAG